MTTTGMLTDMVLVESEKTATIHAPVKRVDIADWLLHPPDAEYQLPGVEPQLFADIGRGRLLAMGQLVEHARVRAEKRAASHPFCKRRFVSCRSD